MQRLLILILTCFYFTAPVQSYAGEVSKKCQPPAVQRAATHTTISKRSAATEFYADLTRLLSLRSGNTQVRYAFPARHFTASATDACAIAGDKSNYVIPAFLYCKSIGLLLVFPQHYFW